MSQVLTLELNDEVYALLKQQAEVAGMPLSEWVTLSLERRSGLARTLIEAEAEALRRRFRRHAGSIDLGYATGAGNEGIDADLAKAYSNELGESA